MHFLNKVFSFFLLVTFILSLSLLPPSTLQAFTKFGQWAGLIFLSITLLCLIINLAYWAFRSARKLFSFLKDM